MCVWLRVGRKVGVGMEVRPQLDDMAIGFRYNSNWSGKLIYSRQISVRGRSENLSYISGLGAGGAEFRDTSITLHYGLQIMRQKSFEC